MPNQILEYNMATTEDVDWVQVTRNSSDGRTDRGNKNIPELSLESAGITTMHSSGIS